MAGISVPLLHIAEPTDKAIKAQGLQKVALMGTKTNHVNDSMHYITLA
jgi:aspartate/glutamate racemase